jgi:hypothetical protein
MRSIFKSGSGKAPCTFGSCANLPWSGNTVVMRSPHAFLISAKNTHLIIDLQAAAPLYECR